MRGGARQRPNSQHGSMHVSVPPVRKIFNCIVDDSALVAGVKRSTRNGIRQWVRNGQIRLFVPLHALDQLSRQREAPGKHGEDVRETLQWLDDITSKSPDIVTLQGADETYEQWAEVEKFVVPRTLFSENDGMDDFTTDTTATTADNLAKLALDDSRKPPASSVPTDATRSLSPSSFHSQRSSMSAPSPPTSPIKETVSPVASMSNQTDNTTSPNNGTVPVQLQPLFNYILWRIHQEVDPVAALESFIFLCNDQRKVNFSKGFEVKTKRLEQLREAVNREDRDFKNRMTLLNKEGQNDVKVASKTEEEDDEVVYKPPPRAPAAMLPKQRPAQPQTNVMDPNDFGRKTQPAKEQSFSPKSPAAQAIRGTFNNQMAARGTLRGNFRGSARGRGNFSAPAPRPIARPEETVAGDQIDPNSFTRPRGAGYAGRGARKLWVPT